MVQHNVVEYIVRGESLVAFVHENDENPLVGSGLPVPAGTVHEGDELNDAVLRETFEETGLRAFGSCGIGTRRSHLALCLCPVRVAHGWRLARR